MSWWRIFTILYISVGLPVDVSQGGHAAKGEEFNSSRRCQMVMLLIDEPNIREVVCFPMNQKAEDLLMQAPSPVDPVRLKELSIKVDIPLTKQTKI